MASLSICSSNSPYGKFNPLTVAYTDVTNVFHMVAHTVRATSRSHVRDTADRPATAAECRDFEDRSHPWEARSPPGGPAGEVSKVLSQHALQPVITLAGPAGRIANRPRGGGRTVTDPGTAAHTKSDTQIKSSGTAGPVATRTEY